MGPIETTWKLFQPPMETALAWGARNPGFLGGRLAGVEGLCGFSKRYGRTSDCYFTPNPVVGEFFSRPSTANVSHVRVVIIDIDPIHGTNGSFSAEEAERRILDHAQDLLGFEIHPDRIDSGRGRQLWLRFEPTPVSTKEEKLLWGAAVGAFLHRLDKDLGSVGGCRVDTSCSDLPRLVRLPGTINTKTGRFASFLGLGEPDDRIRTAILSRFGVSSPRERPSSHVLGNGCWQRSAHWLSGRAKQFLYNGVGEPGRHAAAYAASASMKELGAGYEATERAVLLGASKCSPPLSEWEAKRCVRNAFERGMNGA